MKLSLAQKWCISEFPPPPLKANGLFCKFFLNFTLFWTKLRVLVPCFPDFKENYNNKWDATISFAIIMVIAQNQK